MWVETINRKREEYNDMVVHYFGKIQFHSVEEIKSGREMSQYEKKHMK